MLQEATSWKSSQLMSNLSYEINFYRDKDFKTVELHSHDFFELYFFMHGCASYIVENVHYSLEPGDILLISPNNLHQLDIKDSSETYERIVLWINPNFLRKISTQNTDLRLCFKKSDATGSHLIRNASLSESVRSELTRLYEISSLREYGSDVEAEIHIKNVLLSLGYFYLNASGTSSGHAEQNSVITAAVEYIGTHLGDDLSLDTLAEALFVNKYYLAHLFKQETNTSPHRYILKKRLLLSKQLIEQGLAISDVYTKCGFLDYTHFFRAFKQEYGITPKSYFTLINRR